jgi:hypothetical protein
MKTTQNQMALIKPLIVLAAHNAIIFANGGVLAWRQRARQYVKSVV